MRARERATAERGLILMCKKCGKKMDGDPLRRLKDAFKSVGAGMFGKKGLRVVTTSCLKLCPKRAIAVVVVPLAPGGSGPRFHAVAPEDFDTFAREGCASL